MLQPTRVSGIPQTRPAKSPSRYFQRSIAVLACALSVLLSPAAQAQFATPGQFDVTPTGAASYTIPIAVPPGTAGMAPSLALSYNSQGGNGLLGMGWSLSGLSAITRCPKTLVQDGVKENPAYTNADQYCLDGQRLIVSNGGVYGANGTEYRTEREGFSKVVSYGVIGTTGPAWFKVWTKSGQILQFGATADSRIEAQGKSAVRVWAVNYIADTKGNYLTVTYTEDNANGQYYPSRIDYTGNTAAGLAPYNSVRFVYATRPDITPLYDGGSLIQTTVRLTNVQTWAKVNNVDTMVKDYRLAYDTSAATQRSRLTSLKECDGGEATAVCLQPTTFTWPINNNSLALPAYASPVIPATISGYYSYHSAAQYMQVADFNGDGKMDYMWIPNNSDGRWLAAYSTGNGFTLPSYSAPAIPAAIDGYHSFNGAYMHFADFNGDGKMDYMWRPDNGDGRWLVAYSTGNGFALPSYSAPAIPAAISGYYSYHDAAQYMRVADFNGDGKMDYMWIPNNSDGRWLAAYSTGNGFTLPSYSAPAIPAAIDGYHSFNGAYMHFADFNGDGKMDYMWRPDNGDGRWLAAYSTGNGFTLPSYSAPAIPATISGYYSYHSAAQYMRVADFNGDGKMDYMWIPNNSDGRWLAAYSTGNGFTLPSYSAPAIPATISGYYSYHSAAQYMQVADFNGDGKMDYMWIPNNSDGRWLAAYSTGNGFTLPSYSAPAIPATISGYYSYHSAAQYMQVADFNGDGKMDYMWIPNNSDGRWLAAYSTGNGFTLPSYSAPAIPAAIDGYHSFNGAYMHFADFNGDGKMDYMWRPDNGDGRWLVAYHSSNDDLLANMSTALGATTLVTYKPLTDSTVYTKDSTAEYPVVDIQAPLYVVSSVASSNGIGGNYVSNYSYIGGKAHVRGGGFLGFRQVKSTDAQTDIVSTTTYGQGKYGNKAWSNPSLKDTFCASISQLDSSYPYCLFDRGLPLSAEKRTSSNGLLNKVSNTWAFDTGPSWKATSPNWSGQYHAPQLRQSIESSYELATTGTGLLISTVTTCTEYIDGYGNPTYIGVWTTTTAAGINCAAPPANKTGYYVKETTNIYTNDIVRWYLGRLTKATVESTTP